MAAEDVEATFLTRRPSFPSWFRLQLAPAPLRLRQIHSTRRKNMQMIRIIRLDRRSIRLNSDAFDVDCAELRELA